MPPGESVTEWIRQAKAGDATAVQHLCERYFRRLVALARKKLQGVPRRAADEEDVALSVFDSLCRAMKHGRFPNLDDRDSLWGLLLVLTARKAADQVHHERRQKRGGGAVQGETAFLGAAGPTELPAGLEDVVGREPTPAFAAQVAEECQRLLDRLNDPTLRQVALWKMEGYTSKEIGAKLGRVPRTVERKLSVIRGLWSQEMPS
jgi:DNA-directed RNA polymerase specialized sigma24 family protein